MTKKESKRQTVRREGMRDQEKAEKQEGRKKKKQEQHKGVRN